MPRVPWSGNFRYRLFGHATIRFPLRSGLASKPSQRLGCKQIYDGRFFFEVRLQRRVSQRMRALTRKCGLLGIQGSYSSGQFARFAGAVGCVGGAFFAVLTHGLNNHNETSSSDVSLVTRTAADDDPGLHCDQGTRWASGKEPFSPSGIRGDSMKTVFFSLVVVGLAAGGAVYYTKHVAADAKVSFRTAAIKRDNLTNTINSTGTMEPEEVIDVGAQVVGIIKSLGPDPSPPRKDDRLWFGGP